MQALMWSIDQEISDLNVANAIIANDLFDDTQVNDGLTTKNGPGKEDGKVTVVKNLISQVSSAEIEDKCLPIDVTTLIPPPDAAVIEGDQQSHSSEKVNPVPACPELIFEEAELENNIPLFEDEEEDPSEVEEDDPEELIFAEDLEEYLNEPDEEMMVTNESGNSFHSTRNSMLSSSSMANKMDGLAMNVEQGSNSNSSKRKTNEGDEGG